MTALEKEIAAAEATGQPVFIVYYSNDNESVFTLKQLYNQAQKHFDGNVWQEFGDDVNELINWILDCFSHVESIDPVSKTVSCSQLAAA